MKFQKSFFLFLFFIVNLGFQFQAQADQRDPTRRERRGPWNNELHSIELYVLNSYQTGKVEESSILRLNPDSSIDFEIRGLNRFGREIEKFDFEPEILADPLKVRSLYLETLSEENHQYRLYMNADIGSQFLVRIFDREHYEMNRSFSIHAEYELRSVKMYLETEGYHRFLNDGEILNLEPNGSLVFEVRGFDRSGRQLDKFEFNPQVEIVGGRESYLTFKKLRENGHHYELSVDGEVHEKFEVRVYDSRRRELASHFFVQSQYILSDIRMYLEDDGYHRYLESGEHLVMEPGNALLFEVRGFDRDGRQLDKFEFNPEVRIEGNRSSVRLERVQEHTGRHYRLVADSSERDRFEVVVYDGRRRDIERKFYVTIQSARQGVNEIKIFLGGSAPISDGHIELLEEGTTLNFTVRAFDRRGRELEKHQFNPDVELRNYSGDPKDAYLEVLAGREHSFRLHFLRATPHLGKLEVVVRERDSRVSASSFFVDVNEPVVDDPNIIILSYNNDRLATDIRFSGTVEGFKPSDGWVETTHPRASPERFQVRVQGEKFITEPIALKPDGVTTIKIVLQNRRGDEISSEGYAKHRIPGYQGFKSTQLRRR
ncbi:MAG: hypothetical protein HYW47_07790 [Deltaproteobacteria bacterium]|nr:hypothetical protein [Deltaproteobacteria bacterium]